MNKIEKRNSIVQAGIYNFYVFFPLNMNFISEVGIVLGISYKIWKYFFPSEYLRRH